MNRSGPRARRAFPVSCLVLAALGTVTVPALRAQGIQRDAAIISEAVSSRVDAYIYKVGTRSKLEFRGTTLAARAFGTAKVSAETTRTNVDAEFEKLPQPGELGPYTVYVLWAITPEGRASSLGVLALSGSGKADIEVGTPLNGFAMILTAEPHFLVSVPSTQVVMRNVAVEFNGRTQPVTTLADRADYANLTKLAPATKRPIQVDQASYAVAIAAAAGAERLASGPFATATAALAAADTAWRAKKSAERKRAPELGRVAVQAGEDARVAAVRRAEEIKGEEAQKQAAESQRNAERAAALALSEAARAREAEGSAAKARAELLARMNQVLPTRDTPRGLVAEIGGVLFATAKATLASRRARAWRASRACCRRTRTEAEDRRTHRQHRQRGDQPQAVERSGAVGARLPRRPGCAGHRHRRRGPRPRRPGRRQRHGGRPRAQPARRGDRLGRGDHAQALSGPVSDCAGSR